MSPRQPHDDTLLIYTTVSLQIAVMVSTDRYIPAGRGERLWWMGWTVNGSV